MALRGKMMKQLVVATMLMALTACTGCESTPEIVTINQPYLSPDNAETIPKVDPVETIALFVSGDEIIINNGDGTTVDGIIIAVGQMGLWVNSETKEEVESRVYLVRMTIDGRSIVGKVPEFAMVLKHRPSKKK